MPPWSSLTATNHRYCSVPPAPVTAGGAGLVVDPLANTEAIPVLPAPVTRRHAYAASALADEATVKVVAAVPTTPTKTAMGDADAPPCVSNVQPELDVDSVEATPGDTRMT